MGSQESPYGGEEGKMTPFFLAGHSSGAHVSVCECSGALCVNFKVNPSHSSSLANTHPNTQVASLFLVRQAMGWPGHNTLPRPIAGFVGLAGVYDVDEHYSYEARRCVCFHLCLRGADVRIRPKEKEEGIIRSTHKQP